MDFDYNELERQLEKACVDVKNKFHKNFNSTLYLSAGGGKLESFINDLQGEFEAVAAKFITDNALQKDTEAKKRIFNITKLYAKKCVEDFSKI
ncbi:hypothetical protein ACLI09_08665 [Flavobacterium sp. RHBU_24]|uniref:hypothetical protein n=1 Tax=Flavobacterium sp. RHBU_24 TaxID=3391185 RepID=UPI00398569B9